MIDDAERAARNEAFLLEEAVPRALARIPLSFADDREKYEQAVTSKKLRAIAERYDLSKGSLLVLGSTAVGKTTSVARAVRRLIRAAERSTDPILSVRWTNGSTLAAARRNHRLGEGDPPEITSATRAKVLVIDELAARPDDGELMRILDDRYLRRRPTLITSGATLDELRQAYSPACVRRMHEPAGLVVEEWESRK